MESDGNKEIRPKYPQVVVSYLKCKGDVHKLLKRSLRGIKKAGACPGEIEEYAMSVTGGTYVDMIQIMQKWVTVIDLPGKLI